VIARALHSARTAPADFFVPLNCTTWQGFSRTSCSATEGRVHGRQRAQKGLFELADGGTLFFSDETAEWNPGTPNPSCSESSSAMNFRPWAVSPKVKIDLSVIAARTANLEENIRAGSFAKISITGSRSSPSSFPLCGSVRRHPRVDRGIHHGFNAATMARFRHRSSAPEVDHGARLAGKRPRVEERHRERGPSSRAATKSVQSRHRDGFASAARLHGRCGTHFRCSERSVGVTLAEASAGSSWRLCAGTGRKRRRRACSGSGLRTLYTKLDEYGAARADADSA